MDPLTEVIIAIAKFTHVPPVTAGIMIPLLITMANRAAKMIPDDATGPLKWLLVASRIIGLHVEENRGNAREDTPVEPATQGELLLDNTMRPDPFGRGAAAISRED